jgi:hypothetical protein
MTGTCSDLGEQVLGRLCMRWVDYEQAIKIIRFAFPQGRHTRIHSNTARHANTVVDMVALAEEFSTERLTGLRPQLPYHAHSNWESRKKSWLKHLGIDFAKINGWVELAGFIEARNALQHGQGRLTNKQLDNRAVTIAKLAAARLTLVGDCIVIDEAVTAGCYVSCKAFITSLDASVP